MDYSNTSAHQFNGNNFGAGGGFMPQSPGGAMAMQTTPMSTTRARPNYDEQCLLPLSIKQIMTAQQPQNDQNLKIDGQEVYHVTIVGFVAEIDSQTTHTTFNVRDESGMIPCKMWSSEADPQRAEKIAQIQPNQWIRVIGRIQVFQGSFSMTAFSIIPIENFDEITFHLLEVIHAHLHNTSVSTTLNFDADVTMSEQMGGMSMGGSNMGLGGRPLNLAGDNGFQQEQDSGMGPTHTAILRMMNDPSYANIPEGVHVDMVFQNFPNIDRNVIRQALEELSNEGLVYSTVDDEHFKGTGN